jgi:hypothetical protein
VAIVAAGAKATAPTGVFLTPETPETPEKPAPAAQPVKTAGL